MEYINRKNNNSFFAICIQANCFNLRRNKMFYSLLCKTSLNTSSCAWQKKLQYYKSGLS